MPGNESKGIHQSDVIIRTAIVRGLGDMRANAWLLDYVFASLPQDEVTFKEYGEKSVQRAKEWFLRTPIDVVMAPHLNEGSWPRITIHLADSTEAEVTLGDTHYQPYEDVASVWPNLTPKFTPISYNAATGIMGVVEGALKVVVAPGMIVIDNTGREHPIIDTFDDGSFQVNPGTVADFTNSVIRGARPSSTVALESVAYRETYQIGVHVGSEPAYLTWLHSIVVFALLRYKQALLEARGFERSVASSSDFVRNETFQAENVFSRYISLTGYVRQYWPKALTGKIDTITGVGGTGNHLVIEQAGRMPADTDPRKQLWIGPDDAADLEDE